MATSILLPRHPCRMITGILILLFCFVVVTGCVSTGKPSLYAESYLLDYSPLPPVKLSAVDEAIRLNRFTIAAAYNNTRMIYRGSNYTVDSFNYNRWAVNPADMISDILLRDLQHSGLFRAVFSRYVVEEGRYILQGGVEEFFLRMDRNGNTAVLSLDITIKDMKQKEAVKRILFQKKYHQEESLADNTPQGYCRAMSQALQKLSRQIVTDIYEAAARAEK